MKAIIVLMVSIVVVTSAEFVPVDSFANRSECDGSDNFKVTKEHKEKYSKLEYPDDKITHKHVRCVSEKFFKTWNENDGYVFDLMIKSFGENKKEILGKCLTKRNPEWTVEKWAWNDWKCLAENGITKP